MKKRLSVNKNFTLSLVRELLSHEFLVTVAVMVLLILTFSQITSQNKQPAHDDLKASRTSKFQHKPKRPKVVSPDKLPISVYRGPVNPIPIPAGLPPVIDRVPTNLPVVFVTIDDGWVQTKENLNWLTTHHLPFSLFLSDAGVRSNYQYFIDLQASGMAVQNHTISHHSLLKMTLDQQKAEICGASDTYQAVFKHRPTLFRPPYGEYSDVTRQAVADCGMRAVIMWKATLEGGAIHYQLPNNRLQPGDIVLLHFEPDLIPNMQALSVELAKNRLQVAQLEDWIK